jgi:hypothetical protein
MLFVEFLRWMFVFLWIGGVVWMIGAMLDDDPDG